MFTVSPLNTLAAVLMVASLGCASEGITGSSTDALTARSNFDLFVGNDGQHYFNLEAGNGATILSSEGYTSRQGAINGVLSVLDNGEDARRYQIRLASNGEMYFVLKARNGEIIGQSETYKTRQNVENGVDAVVRSVGVYLDSLANHRGARFDVFAGGDGQHYFNLHAANGEVVLTSEGYSSEAAAYNGAYSVLENGVDEGQYELAESVSGEFYFNVKAKNGEIVGTSEMYATEASCSRAVSAVASLLGDMDIL